MKDIETKNDLEILIEKFYKKLLANPKINFIFTDVAKINLKTHLAKIVDFWNLSLFGEPGYNTNVMRVHMDLNDEISLQPEHFQIWLDTFYETIDENFSGPTAESTKTRALSIATVMQIKTHR